MRFRVWRTHRHIVNSLSDTVLHQKIPGNYVVQPSAEVHEDPVVLVDKYPKKEFLHASLVSPVLFKTKSFWLFDFLPDELIIEEKRIIIKQKHLPYSVTILTIPLNRLFAFQVTKSIFFSSIYIKGDYASNIEYTMRWVNHNDAHCAIEIVDGLKLKENESIKIMNEDGEKYTQTLQVMGGIY